jgi:hypothetical protein
MSKRDPNRPMKGDWVRIDNPQMFVRCGYPISIAEVREQVEKDHQKEIEDFIDRIARGKPEEDIEDIGTWKLRTRIKQNDIPSKSTRKIIEALAYERLKAQGFGGKERTVHTDPAPDMKGKIFQIERTKCCMTGKYYAPSGGYDSWSGEYDYEPGGLMNQKCHRILCLRDEAYGEAWIHYHDPYNYQGYRIEDIHVTKIEDPKEYLENERKKSNRQVAEA